MVVVQVGAVPLAEGRDSYPNLCLRSSEQDQRGSCSLPFLWGWCRYGWLRLRGFMGICQRISHSTHKARRVPSILSIAMRNFAAGSFMSG